MSTHAPEKASFRYSRDDILDPKGLETWREVIGRTLTRLDLSVLPDGLFHSEAQVFNLPGRVGFGASVNSSMRLERTRELVTDADDDLVLYYCASGRLIMSQFGRTVTIGEGEAVLLSHADTGSIITPSLSRSLMVRLPRNSLTQLVQGIDDWPMRPIRKDCESLRLLLGYVGALGAPQPVNSPQLRRLAATHIRDLLAATLGASGDGAVIAANGGVRAARLWAIKADIERRVEDPNLSVATVAARHGISPRYVQALFEDEEVTFSAYVLSRRLARVYRLLASPQHRHLRIAEIAYSVGFGDLSHFNRAFRRRYGLAPSGVRATAFTERPMRA